MKKKKNFLFIFFIITIVLISGCSVEDEPITIIPVDSVELPQRGFFMGVLPTATQDQLLEDVYSNESQYIEFVPVWGRPTPFYDLATDLEGDWGEIFVKQLIRDNGMFPIINMSFIDTGLTLVIPPDMENATLSDSSWREAYKQAAIEIVKASSPKYLSLGNEVNRWYEKYGTDGDNGFEYYVSLYEEIYDEIKELSPETQIFCIFAREIVDENREADMEVLKMFDQSKMDILVFTSYPYAVQGINSPEDIADDYYLKVSNYMPNKPIGFTEIAWTSLDAFGGEQAQSDFITQLIGCLTVENGVDLILFGWPWLCDLSENDGIGLIKVDGTEKLAYSTWKNLSLQK